MLCPGDYWTEDEGNNKMKEFAAGWNDKASWEKRAEKIRQNILNGLQFSKMPKESAIQSVIIRSERKMNGYVIENLAIESFPGFYITGNIYRPFSDFKKHAAILLTHGHGREGRFERSIQQLGASLARMGAIVFAYDMVGYGECLQVSHNIPVSMLLQTFNSKRVVDYLISRNDVDANRIGITGASGGGTQTFLLTAIDPRINVSVPVVQVSAHFFGGCGCESGMPVHKSAGLQTNNAEITALCAPRPLLVISDAGDWTCNVPRVEYPYIQKVYALYNAEHKAENVHFANERHDYGVSKREVAYLFFARHLQLDIGKIPYREKDDSVAFLPADSLKVFDVKNPFPSNQLSGNKAVMNYLKVSN